MHKKKPLSILLLLFLFLTACSGQFQNPIEITGQEDPEFVSEFDPPHNLNDHFIDDLQDLRDAPVYSIEMIIDPEDDIMRVIGSQEVRYTNQESEPLDRIYFRLFPNVGGDYLAVSDVQINGAVVTPQVEYKNTALRLDLEDLLLPGESITIAMNFDQVVPSEMGGNYGLYIFFDNILALDAFFPIIPVYNDEGWNVEDPPHNADMIFTDAAFFTVTVDAPEDFILAAGGKETGREVTSGRQIVTFDAGPQRDFYLAASPDFISETTIVDDIEVTSYFLESYRDAGERVLKIGVDALNSFSERFGPYPYNELDMVSTPMQAGGMEYSNIVALGLFFYDPESTTSSGVPGSVFLESATAHEVGHEWFYCQVMSDQIDEPWMDESLVQYATYLYYLDTYGPSGADGFKESLYQRWDRVEMDEIPIGKPAAHYSPQEYGAIVYGRGALFFEDLAKEMGEENFKAFIKDYVASFRWGIAEPLEMIDLAQEFCGCDLSDLINEWGIYG